MIDLLGRKTHVHSMKIMGDVPRGTRAYMWANMGTVSTDMGTGKVLKFIVDTTLH
ncbi:hypothetical protein vBAfQDWS535_61 [Alcaligenes phage vB_Af_QDWS535]|nr:hypothetical protein vBAfQDWS535_61 [Alcaligenes phage vB_Af_QDWS535]